MQVGRILWRARPAASGLILCLAVTMTMSACADEGPQDSDLLPPPAEGYQYRMELSLPAGVEAEFCQFVLAPAEGMYINRDEVRYTAGSHHFLLYETAYTEIPTAKDDGTPVDTSGVFDCSDGATNGWSVTRLVGGSQNAAGDSMVDLPPGVAIPVTPGRVLLMNAHYINTTDQPLDTEVRINLHTLAESEVEEYGDILFLYNPFIKVTAGGSASARMRCPVHHDITIMNVQSHMHARGVDYAASVDGGEPFYTNDLWADVPAKSFADQGGLVVPAGAMLDYECFYQNPEARDVYQGPRSTDEMCMLIGSYYPANPAIANCRDETGALFASEWVGSGTATCAESLACIQSAVGNPDIIQALTPCMVDAAPEVSRQLSQAFLCMMQSLDPAVDCAPLREACQAL